MAVVKRHSVVALAHVSLRALFAFSTICHPRRRNYAQEGNNALAFLA
jgi:hypothetical protein